MHLEKLNIHEFDIEKAREGGTERERERDGWVKREHRKWYMEGIHFPCHFILPD